MAPTYLLFSVISVLFLTSVCTVSPTNAFALAHRPLCHKDEGSALLRFKESFFIDTDDSYDDPSAYPKVKSWKLNGASDCCSWDGVECDRLTGHVIGLDVSSSGLYGSINSSNSLFSLIHLRKLNLAFNHFNYSLIPSGLGHLSKLTYLNISSSSFSGHLPSNVSDLVMLSSLDLSGNYQLFFKKPDFKSLVDNLTRLEVLNLSGVDISSPVPSILANSSSLSSILLCDCGLYGVFPAEIFQLPRLEILHLESNQDLTGQFPEFQSSSPLRILALSLTTFSGEIPWSIGNLNSLTFLDLSGCNFSGQFPYSLGNLTQLSYLNFSENTFDVQHTSSMSWFGKLTKLTTLSLFEANLNGEIPSSFANLTQLSFLGLRMNRLIGPIPSWLMNLTQLTFLTVYANRLQGPIPESISELRNLEHLNLADNNFSGTVELDIFHKLKNLYSLDVSQNSISLVANANSNATLQKFGYIGFGSCNLGEFPDFLRHQDELLVLLLPNNNIPGQIPKWLWDASKDTLQVLDLSRNFLTGFEAHPVVFPWMNAPFIYLHSNMLQGSLPLPPPLVEIYTVNSNNLTGELSPSFCNLTSLHMLRLDDNDLSGMLPSCLGNFSTHLEYLNIGGNNFYGIIPVTFSRGSKLKMIGLGDNRLRGRMPRSLINCTMLEFIDLGNNQIRDIFPSWLGALPNLKVLILRSNEFHGKVSGHKTRFGFAELRIIDLSQNNFSGQLPIDYFLSWIAMKMVDPNATKYLGFTPNSGSKNFAFVNNLYTMTMTNKGVKLQYNQIMDFFAAIDLSCNRFEGSIPKIIGNLSRLRLLNLSNNNLSGGIPPSLGDLTKLESLDLSQNGLSGAIPEQLSKLNFLEVFDVSNNRLTGPIPHGKQFDTFQNDSYEGNWGLCGDPLSRKCETLEALPPTGFEKDQGLGSPVEFGWKPVAIGYSCGLIIGLVIGHIVVIRKFEWFANTFRLKQRRATGGRRRN